MLDFRLLGGLRIFDRDDAEVQLSQRKAKALCVYLAVSAGHPKSRDALATLLWAERDQARARQSLRQTLSTLRRAIPDGERCLVAQDDQICFAADAIVVDVSRFDALVASDDVEDLDAAIALYNGDFLEGFDAGSPEFEHWHAIDYAAPYSALCRTGWLRSKGRTVSSVRSISLYAL